MIRWMFVTIAAAMAVSISSSAYVAVGAGAATPVVPQAAAAQPAPQSAESQRALLNRYCVACHNERLKSGGLALDAVSVADVSAHADVWEKVVRKTRAG